MRGVGKTTTARILARALNYALPDGSISGPTIHMPLLGLHDQAIMESRQLDVIEAQVDTTLEFIAQYPGFSQILVSEMWRTPGQWQVPRTRQPAPEKERAGFAPVPDVSAQIEETLFA